MVDISFSHNIKENGLLTATDIVNLVSFINRNDTFKKSFLYVSKYHCSYVNDNNHIKIDFIIYVRKKKSDKDYIEKHIIINRDINHCITNITII